MIYCFDRNEKLMAVLDNQNAHTQACPYYDAVMHEVLNGEFYFKFAVPLTYPAAYSLTNGGYVGIRDNDSTFQLFLITDVDDRHGMYPIRRITAEQAASELNDEICSNIDFPSGTAVYDSLNAILNLSRWKPGITPSGPGIALKIDTATKREALSIYRGRAQADLTFRTELNPQTQMIERYVDWYSYKGQNRGRRFEYGKDVLEIEREVDFSNIKTCMIGKAVNENGDPIYFTDVVWTTPPNYLPKPAGQMYLENPAARTKWGRPDRNGNPAHLWGWYITEEQNMSPEALLTATYHKLMSLAEPKVRYRCNVIDLARLLSQTGAVGITQQPLMIGDTIDIIDRDLQLAVEGRVLERTIDLIEREKSTVVFGQYIERFTRTVGGVSASAPSMTVPT